MHKAEAFPIVLKQAFRSSRADLNVRILDMERRILEAVDFYRLGCNMEPEAALTAWQGMNRTDDT